MFRSRLTAMATASLIVFFPHLSMGQSIGQGDMVLSSDGHAATVSPEEGSSMASDVRQSLRFEPITMLSDLYRDDIVLLMRHGPTDWSQIDRRGVAASDCQHQRRMTEAGKDEMRQLGMHLVISGIVPAEIRFSQWCRNVETVDAVRAGMLSIDSAVFKDIRIVQDPGLNLLLSLGGAETVAPIRTMIDEWMADDPSGPLLLITHYTNIEELTDFRVYEGEILILDPLLENRVLGYLRLQSAGPDAVHFD